MLEQILYPIADGLSYPPYFYAGSLSATGSPHYQQIDEPFDQCDGHATRVWGGGDAFEGPSATAERFTLQNLPADFSGIISSVTVKGYFTSDYSEAFIGDMGIFLTDTISRSSNIISQNAGEYILAQYEFTKKHGGGLWTPADVNNLDIFTCLLGIYKGYGHCSLLCAGVKYHIAPHRRRLEGE